MTKRRWTVWILGIALLLIVSLPPRAALARNTEPERVIVDARYEAYPRDVTLEEKSTALTWMVLIVLGVLSLVVMFKDAKRTHLD